MSKKQANYQKILHFVCHYQSLWLKCGDGRGLCFGKFVVFGINILSFNRLIDNFVYETRNFMGGYHHDQRI